MNLLLIFDSIFPWMLRIIKYILLKITFSNNQKIISFFYIPKWKMINGKWENVKSCLVANLFLVFSRNTCNIYIYTSSQYTNFIKLHYIYIYIRTQIHKIKPLKPWIYIAASTVTSSTISIYSNKVDCSYYPKTIYEKKLIIPSIVVSTLNIIHYTIEVASLIYKIMLK